MKQSYPGWMSINGGEGRGVAGVGFFDPRLGFSDSAKQAILTKLFGMTFLVGKIKFKRLLFHGPKWLSKFLFPAFVQGCRFVPYIFGNKPPQMVWI